MADLLTLDEIEDITDAVAPSEEDEVADLIEVWRLGSATPAASPVRGGAGVNEWGVPVSAASSPTASPSARPDQQARLVGTYAARVMRVGVGTEPTFGGQPVSVGDWMVEMRWGTPEEEADIDGGDLIRIALTAFKEASGVRERVVWAPNTEYARGALVQPSVSNGWAYRCVGAGHSGALAPAWPPGPKGTAFADGTARWSATPLRTLQVQDPSSRPTYAITRIVRCKEIT